MNTVLFEVHDIDGKIVVVMGKFPPSASAAAEVLAAVLIAILDTCPAMGAEEIMSELFRMLRPDIGPTH